MMRKNFEKFAEETGFGGISYAVRVKGCARKAFWITLLGLCLTGLIFQTIWSVQQFMMAMPATSLTILPVKSLKLPDIVVCFPAKFDKDRLQMHGVSDTMSDTLQMAFLAASVATTGGRKIEEQLPDLIPTAIQGMAELEEYNQTSPMKFEDLVELLSFDCEDLFYEKCYVHGVSTDCCRGARKLWTEQGLCFEFKGREQFVSGSGQGIFLRIVLPRDRFQSGPNMMFNDGVAVRFSRNGEIERDVSLVPAGSRAHIDVGITHGVYLPSKKNPCEVYPKQSHHGCISECLISSAMDGCDCNIIDIIGMLRKRPICSVKDTFNCMQGLKVDPDDTEASTRSIKACSETCRTSCETWEYKKQVSFIRQVHSLR